MTAASALTNPRPLAVTMGEPAGIGIEISLLAWASRRDERLHPFVLFADAEAVTACANALGLKVPIRTVDALSDGFAQFPTVLPVRQVALSVAPTPGQPDERNAGGTISCIDAAVAAVHAGEALAVVTNPIAKHVLYASGFRHPGHTEYLAALADRHYPGPQHRPVMMLASDALRVVPLTVHIPLGDVAPALSQELIVSTARTTANALRDDFGIDQPRLAVCGLNPHAGEGGTIGREDVEIIAPAIAALRREGLSVSGPHSADTLFHASARSSYDAVIAMYHDQALIPLKTLAFDEGVNVTLGLPFVRTSPDHGTAFDIAGRGLASPLSLIRALQLAERMASRRSHHVGAA